MDATVHQICVIPSTAAPSLIDARRHPILGRKVKTGVVAAAAATAAALAAAIGRHVFPTSEGNRGFDVEDMVDASMDAEVGEALLDRSEMMESAIALRHVDEVKRLGACIPSGMLVVGPQGCGKILMCRSMARYAGIALVTIHGSTISTASSIHDAFRVARSKVRCVVLVDEVDALWRTGAGTSLPFMYSSSELFLRLLVEIDAVHALNARGSAMITVVGVTSRLDAEPDLALVRHGRLDRRIAVDMPNATVREAVLRANTRTVPLASDVRLDNIASNTPRFSIPDLVHLCNDAVVRAVMTASDEVSAVHFEMALEPVLLSSQTSDLSIMRTYVNGPSGAIASKRTVIAYHEAGHVLAGMFVSDYDSLRKVSIVPRAGAGGATYFQPSEDRLYAGGLVSREYLFNSLIVLLGGRAAEELVFGHEKATTGASEDLKMVFDIAKKMVCYYGFNDRIGPMFVGEGVLRGVTDAEIHRLTQRAYAAAQKLIAENEPTLHRIAKVLMEKETLTGDEVRELVAADGNDVCARQDLKESL